VYRSGADDASGPLPACYDGKHFFMDRDAGYVKYATVTGDSEVAEIEPFRPATFDAPVDLAVADDGRLLYLDADGTVRVVSHPAGDDATEGEAASLSAVTAAATGTGDRSPSRRTAGAVAPDGVDDPGGTED